MRLAKHITVDAARGEVVIDDVILDFYVADDVDITTGSRTEISKVHLSVLTESVHVLRPLESDIAEIVAMADRHRAELGLPRREAKR